ALWAFHRLMWNGRLRDGVWLGALVAAQLMSCMYYGLFFAIYLVVFGAAVLVRKAGAWRRWLPGLAAGVGTALLLVPPAADHYYSASEIVGERGSFENRKFSAEWSDYLAAPDTNVLLGWTAARFGGGVERQLFQGVVAVALAAIALWPPWSAVRSAYALGLAFA